MALCAGAWDVTRHIVPLWLAQAELEMYVWRPAAVLVLGAQPAEDLPLRHLQHAQ